MTESGTPEPPERVTPSGPAQAPPATDRPPALDCGGAIPLPCLEGRNQRPRLALGDALAVAARVVPNNGPLFATYLALRHRQQAPLHQELLADVGGQTRTGTDLLDSLVEIMPYRSRDLPVEVQKSVDDMLDEVLEQALVQADAFGRGDPTAPGREDRFAVATGGLGGLADLTAEDVGWVYLSNMAYRALVQRADALTVRQDASRYLPALQADIECEISRRLYGDRRFLDFIRQALKARGSFVSPMVRHFTAFYVRCIKEKIQEQATERGVDARFWEERLASLIGRAEARATNTLPKQELVVLGQVVQGELPMDPEDPDLMPRAFRVDAASPRHGLLLSQVQAGMARIPLKAFVKWHFRHLVKRVCFVDDVSF